MDKLTLYKFRSLNNIKYLLDILLNNRLYAARYNELNDPMEGHYLTNSRNKNIINQLRERKLQTRVCSLTKNFNHTLLWSHYADGHCGCAIEVSVPYSKIREISYSEELQFIEAPVCPEDLLSIKSRVWQYENEYRIFSTKPFISVKINRVIFGIRVSKEDFQFYQKLIKAINPSIDVEQIKREDIFDGFTNS